jgi:O-antigen/teichoic acid export membrane protein
MYEARRPAIIDVIVSSGQIVLMIAVALLGAGPVGVAIVISASSALNVVWVGRAALAAAGSGSAHPRHRRALVRGVLPLGTMGVLSKIYLTVDLAIIGGMVTAHSLGEYAGAVKIATLLNMLPGLVMASALPGLAAAIGDSAQLSALVSRVLHWLVALLLPMFVLVILFPEPFVTVALGHAYANAAPLTRILAGAGAVGVISQLLGSTLVAASLVRPLLVQNVCAVVFNVAGNLLLVPTYGVTAAAWLTFGTEAIVCLGSLWTSYRRLHLHRVLRESRRPLAVIVLAVAAGLALQDAPWPGLAVSAAVVVAGFLVTRCLPAEFLPASLMRFASAPTVDAAPGAVEVHR